MERAQSRTAGGSVVRMPGQFAPGQSGNPGGRAKGLTLKIKQATNDGQDLVDYFVGLFYDEKQPERVRTMAANWLADRGYGKPVQTTELTGADGGPVLTGHIDMTGDDLDNLYGFVKAHDGGAKRAG
jgi:hypothetical protein